MSVTTTTLPFAWKATQDALHNWAAGVGLQAIWARQNAPRPTEPFVSLKITQAPTVIGPQEKIYTYDQATDGYFINVCGLAEFTCNAQVFCTVDSPDSSIPAAGQYQQWSDAAGYLSSLAAQLWLPQVQSDWAELGFSVIGCGPITVLDDIASGEFDSRASMDVRLRLGSNYVLTPSQANVGPINQVQFTGDVGGYSDSDTVPQEL